MKMDESQPLNYVRVNYPRLMAKAGARAFAGWMCRETFPDAPPAGPREAHEGCMVLYAPTERFPETATLAQMRAGLRADPAAIAHANDMIVKGAKEDGVHIDRRRFNPHAWAVIPDFMWPEHERTAEGADYKNGENGATPPPLDRDAAYATCRATLTSLARSARTVTGGPSAPGS